MKQNENIGEQFLNLLNEDISIEEKINKQAQKFIEYLYTYFEAMELFARNKHVHSEEQLRTSHKVLSDEFMQYHVLSLALSTEHHKKYAKQLKDFKENYNEIYKHT